MPGLGVSEAEAYIRPVKLDEWLGSLWLHAFSHVKLHLDCYGYRAHSRRQLPDTPTSSGACMHGGRMQWLMHKLLTTLSAVRFDSQGWG